MYNISDNYTTKSINIKSKNIIICLSNELIILTVNFPRDLVENYINEELEEEIDQKEAIDKFDEKNNEFYNEQKTEKKKKKKRK